MTLNQAIRMTSISLILGSIIGCAGSNSLPERGPLLRKASTTDPPSFDITSAPAQMSTLEDGRFEIEGQLIAEAGFAEDEPLVLKVHDVTSGLDTTVDVAAFVEGNEGYLEYCTFDAETGEFTIGGDDMLIDAGDKVITLFGKDTEDRTCNWILVAESDPYWEISSAEMGTARAHQFDQVYAAVDTYRDVIDGFSFEAPFYEAMVEIDLAYLELLLDYIEARSADPTMANASQTGLDFEEAVDSYIGGLSQSLVPGEMNYREGLLNAAGWERSRAQTAQHEAAVFQVSLFPEEADSFYRELRLAHLEHTFISAVWTPGAGTTTIEEPEPNPWRGTLKLIIYQDIGTPPGMFNDEEHPWDPEGLEPETADPDTPGMVVEIQFLDNDDDDLVDEVTMSGLEVDPYTLDENEYLDTDSYGHPVTALQYLFLSGYYDLDRE